MTSFNRVVAGALTIFEALWVSYSYFDSTLVSCPNGGCPGPSFIPVYSLVSPALALLLLVFGALGLWGASFAYVGGAVLSAATLLADAYTVVVVSGYAYLSTASNDAIIGVAFALVALLANVNGVRSKSRLSEQANPMNLPVFG